MYHIVIEIVQSNLGSSISNKKGHCRSVYLVHRVTVAFFWLSEIPTGGTHETKNCLSGELRPTAVGRLGVVCHCYVDQDEFECFLGIEKSLGIVLRMQSV